MNAIEYSLVNNIMKVDNPLMVHNVLNNDGTLSEVSFTSIFNLNLVNWCGFFSMRDGKEFPPRLRDKLKLMKNYENLTQKPECIDKLRTFDRETLFIENVDDYLMVLTLAFEYLDSVLGTTEFKFAKFDVNLELKNKLMELNFPRQSEADYYMYKRMLSEHLTFVISKLFVKNTLKSIKIFTDPLAIDGVTYRYYIDKNTGNHILEYRSEGIIKLFNMSDSSKSNIEDLQFLINSIQSISFDELMEIRNNTMHKKKRLKK